MATPSNPPEPGQSIPDLFDSDPLGLTAGLVEVDEFEPVHDTVTKPGQPSPRFAPVWSELDAVEAASEWESLIGWVNWLVARYRICDRIPKCWALHGAIVEELSALQAAWTYAYFSAAAGPRASLEWHQGFGAAIDRIQVLWRVSCRGDHTNEYRNWCDDDRRAESAQVAIEDCDRRGVSSTASVAAGLEEWSAKAGRSPMWNGGRN